MIQLQAGFFHESFKLVSGMTLDYQNKSTSLSCCRNDWAACSVVLAASEHALLLREPRVAFTPNGPWPVIRIGAQCDGLGDVSVYEAGMFICEDDVKRADVLLDGGYTTLRPWLPVQLYLIIRVPKDSPAGLYHGQVRIYARRMFEDEQLLLQLPFTITVSSVTMPDTRRFYLNLWQHPSNIARKHEVRLFSDEHFSILEHYIRTLGELGNKAATIIASDIPWSGQYCFLDKDNRSDLFEYNYIKTYRNADGSFTYDYSAAERYVELCDRYGCAEEIDIFGLIRIWHSEEHGYGGVAGDYPERIRISYLDRSDGALKFMRTAREIKGYLAALQQWLERKGWLERTVIMTDEPPDMEEFCRSLAALREAAPRLRLQMDVPPAMLSDLPVQEPLHHYTPIIMDFARQPGQLAKCRAMATGKVLYSVCCEPHHPNNFLRSRLVESRLTGWLVSFLGIDGFLRWNYTVWPENPRDNMVYRPGQWESGDTCFVYPSRGGLPLYSLRFFALKRGIEDYELIRMVQERCPNAQDIIDQAYQAILRQRDITKWTFDYGDDRSVMYSVDPKDYDRARGVLIQALEQAQDNLQEDQP